MSLSQTLQVFEAFDSAHASGRTVVDMLSHYFGVTVALSTLVGPKGQTDFVRIVVPGSHGHSSGGNAPSLGVVGRLGGIGARPDRIGLVSNGDGAVAAVATALKLAHMQSQGDVLPGDVIVTTHVCPKAPIRAHLPVNIVGSPIEAELLNAHEVVPEMDAVLSIGTSKGNRILNHKGYALSPTVKQGYILRVADDLVRIMETTSGRPAVTFPITTQDITPCGNGIYHLSGILQPSVATAAPVVGVALCAETVVPGCDTGASHETDIALAVKFAVEVAKEFTRGTCRFHDAEEFERLVGLYGSMAHLQQRRKATEA